MSFKYKSLNPFWDIKYDLYTVCFTCLVFFHMSFILLPLYTFFWSFFQFITCWFACVSPAFKPIFDFLLLIIVILVIHFYFIFYGFQYPPGIFNLLYYFCAYVKHKVYVWWYHTCFWVICELRYSFYIFIMLFKKHRRIYNVKLRLHQVDAAFFIVSLKLLTFCLTNSDNSLYLSHQTKLLQLWKS